MSDPTPPERPTRPADDRHAPWGHSRSAHRVLGACSHCKDYSVEEEVIQWRNREQKRYEREQQALAASADNTTAITATADYDRRCRRCDRPAVTVVKVTGTLDGTVYPLGGWAYCTACLDTPHPTMQEAADA